MSRTKEVGTAVGTLACALAIGFAMQNTETASQRYGALNDTTSSQAVAAATIPTSAVTSKPTMEVQEITPTSALDKDAMPSEPAPKGFLARLFGASPAEAAEPAAPTPAVVQSVEPAPAKEDAIVENLDFAEDRAEPQVVEIVETTETVETPGHICDIVADARPSASAFVTLSVTAGCDPNTSVTVHHNGMQFSVLTDNVGAFTVDVPALSASAVFIVEVEPGRGAVAQAAVEDLARFNRVVVQWQGQSGFELHAREFNAEYGSDGHVWYGADADTARLETGAGGYLVRLGVTATEDALMADVYTFPAAMSARNGQVDLSVEAVVTQSNCGQMIEAQTLELRDNSDLRTQSVTLAVPSCDAIGNFIVLNTLLDDLQIAAR